MFDTDIAFDHVSGVQRTREVVASTSVESVGAAFAASLSSRRLDLRSALGSYAIGRHLPVHPYDGHADVCATCGLREHTRQDQNVLNFERFKWGGVRRDHLAYVVFDLEQFQSAPKLEPTSADLEILRQLLDLLSAAPTTMTAVQLAAEAQVVPGNRDEREILLELLAVSGVLDARRTSRLSIAVCAASRS